MFTLIVGAFLMKVTANSIKKDNERYRQILSGEPSNNGKNLTKEEIVDLIAITIPIVSNNK